MKRKRLMILVLLIICIPTAVNAANRQMSVGIISYNDTNFLLKKSNGEHAEITMYNLLGHDAVETWSVRYGDDVKLEVFSLPGIEKIVLLFGDKLVLLTSSGSVVDELKFDKDHGWHYPIFSAGLKSMAMSDAHYRNILVVTNGRIEIVDISEMRDDPIVTLFAFVDAEGSVYYNNSNSAGYRKVDIEGNFGEIKAKGQLAYVAQDGVWLLRGRKLVLPNDEMIRLPTKFKKYSVGRTHHAGVVISEKLVVSAIEKQPVKWEFNTEEMYGFSPGLRYFLNEGDFDEQVKGVWLVWSIEKGTRKVERKHTLKHSDIEIVDPGFVVFDDGTAFIVGSGYTMDTWQIWKLNIPEGEYTPISIHAPGFSRSS